MKTPPERRTLVEVAGILKISHETVANSERRALAKMHAVIVGDRDEWPQWVMDELARWSRERERRRKRVERRLLERKQRMFIARAMKKGECA